MKTYSGKLCGKIRGTDLSGTIGGLADLGEEKKKKQQLKTERQNKK